MNIQRWVTAALAVAVLPALHLSTLPVPSAQSAPAGATPPSSARDQVTAKPPAHRLDLAAARNKGRSATTSPGKTRPGKTPPAETPPATAPDNVTGEVIGEVAGDVTGDGLADAVVRDPGPDSGSLRVYTHDGSTTSNPWTAFESAGGQWDFADVLLAGDVTGDGRIDVVARDPDAGNGTLWVYPHDGSTTGNPWPSRFAAGTGWNSVNTILLADVTGDGQLDLLTREPGVSAGTLWIHAHNGNTTSNPWTDPRTWAGTGWNLANAMTMGDVTGNGHPDIIARDGAGALWIYPHNGNTSGNPYTSRFGAGTGWEFANALLATDATGDGNPDVVARDDAGALWIYPHNGNTSGNPYTSRFGAGTGWEFANALLTADVTGDGNPEILARVHAGDLWVYPNDGSADGNPWPSRFTAGTRWAFENQLLVSDVTGDGRPDVLARDPGATDGTLWVYPNNSETTSDPWTTPRTFAGTGWNLATAMLTGDLTGDGWTDLVIRDRQGTMWVYPHNGSATGNHWTVSPIWAGSGWNTAAKLALADVDGDGQPDLVDLERDGSLWVYRTGSAGPPIHIDGDWADTDAIAVGDVDGDGHVDLVTREASGALWVHPHDGSSSDANPWTTRRSAGTGWAFASTLLLS